MGGQLFARPGSHGEPGLHVPRMPPGLYKSLRSKYRAILARFYETVITPAEAPEKVDHGDIDFLVSTPLPSMTAASATEAGHWAVLEKVFEAHRSEHHSATKASFAVRRDDEAGETTSYAQIDVHVCEPDHIAWIAFYNSYSDLWIILRTMLRSCGLTGTDKGFFVRAADIEAEAEAKSASFIFLTSDAAETMEFLGLDKDAYYRGFEYEHEIFEWVGSSRLFSRQAVAERRDKTSDRKNMLKRPMYRRFVTEWQETPSAAARDKGPIIRELVFQDALTRFNVGAEYSRALLEFRAMQQGKLGSEAADSSCNASINNAAGQLMGSQQ